ncbi:MAG: ABC transporter permease [Chloroflexi bacterium]|nr:ABC transporter permease [Chloroflexota bacterium]
MTGYIIRRVMWMIPVLFFVSAITFSLMHVVPGGPWDQDKKLPAATIQNLNRQYNLDKPVPIQFGLYIKNLLRGDLGLSFRGDRPVRDRILDGLPITATLGIASFIVGTFLGITLGTLAALKQNTWVDYVTVVISTLGASMPSFVIATFLIIVLAVKLDWVPIIAWREWNQIFTDPKVAVMPVIALSMRETAFLTRVTRASVLEVVRQDYIRTARAKGLVEYVVVLRHLIKNALIPILTLLGPLLAGLVTGSFIIESIFSIPGIGRQFVDAVIQRDYGMIMGTTLFYAALVAIANLTVDVLYGVVDPRIRYS